MTQTASQILNEVLPQIPQYKNPSCDPIEISDNTGAWVSAHLDFDYQQFIMLELRRPYLNPKDSTIVDNLFVFINSHGKREFEWDNHPHELFDTSEYMDPYVRFISWVEQMLDRRYP
jgi:hypothetical protein